MKYPDAFEVKLRHLVAPRRGVSTLAVRFLKIKQIYPNAWHESSTRPTGSLYDRDAEKSQGAKGMP